MFSPVTFKITSGHEDCFSISIQEICDRNGAGRVYMFMASLYLDFMDEGETIMSRVITWPTNVGRYPLDLNHDLITESYEKRDEAIEALSKMDLDSGALIGSPVRYVPWLKRNNDVVHYYVVFKAEDDLYEVVDPILEIKCGKIPFAELQNFTYTIMLTKVQKIPDRSLAETIDLFMAFLNLFAGPSSNNTARDRVNRFIHALAQPELYRGFAHNQTSVFTFYTPIVAILKCFSNAPMQLLDFFYQMEKDYGIDLSTFKKRLTTLSSKWKKETVLFVIQYKKEDCDRDQQSVIHKFREIFDEELALLEDMISFFKELRLSVSYEALSNT